MDIKKSSFNDLADAYFRAGVSMIGVDKADCEKFMANENYRLLRMDFETFATNFFIGKTNSETMLPDGLAKITDPPNGAAIRG